MRQSRNVKAPGDKFDTQSLVKLVLVVALPELPLQIYLLWKYLLKILSSTLPSATVKSVISLSRTFQLLIIIPLMEWRFGKITARRRYQNKNLIHLNFLIYGELGFFLPLFTAPQRFVIRLDCIISLGSSTLWKNSSRSLHQIKLFKQWSKTFYMITFYGSNVVMNRRWENIKEATRCNDERRR